jgi:hypothetical protein
VTARSKSRLEPSGRVITGMLDQNNSNFGFRNKKALRSSAFLISGRRDWTRTNDPHHVKVVL